MMQFPAANATNGVAGGSYMSGLSMIGNPPNGAQCTLTFNDGGGNPAGTAVITFPVSSGEALIITSAGQNYTMKPSTATVARLVNGALSERYSESIALVRRADLDHASHSVSLLVYENAAEPRSIKLARTSADKYWLRVTRAENRALVSWSTDGQVFETVLERAVVSQSPMQTVITCPLSATEMRQSFPSCIAST
jgi:hypothetical protein